MANIAYLLYFIALVNFLLSFGGNGITGLTFVASAVGSIFIFFNNQNVKTENKLTVDCMKYSISAVILANNHIDKNELKYATSLLNQFADENIHKSKLLTEEKFENELNNYGSKNEDTIKFLLDKVKVTSNNLNENVKVAILNYCTMMCIIDGKVDSSEKVILELIFNIFGLSVDIDVYISNTIKKINEETKNG